MVNKVLVWGFSFDSMASLAHAVCFTRQPLVRKDLPDIVRALSSLNGVRNVGVTTNGINLKRKIPALHEAGLTHINVSTFWQAALDIRTYATRILHQP